MPDMRHWVGTHQLDVVTTRRWEAASHDGDGVRWLATEAAGSCNSRGEEE
jgi:hypothetical protein